MSLKLEDIGKTLKSMLSWEKIGENLPMLGAIALGLIIIDKFVNLEEKLRPMLMANQYLNDTSKLFTTIDNAGDNIQLLDGFLDLWGVKLADGELKKIGDWLQNLGTSGKWIKKFWNIIMSTLGTSGESGNLLGFKGSGKNY